MYKIYYAAGSSRERIAQLPMVTAALSHGFDVLLCTQDVDEFMFQVWRNYEVAAHVQDGETSEKATRELAFTNVSAAGLDFATKEEKEKAQKTQEEHKGVFEALKDALESKVNDVRVSAELGDFPARFLQKAMYLLRWSACLSKVPTQHTRRVHSVFWKLTQSILCSKNLLMLVLQKIKINLNYMQTYFWIRHCWLKALPLRIQLCSQSIFVS